MSQVDNLQHLAEVLHLAELERVLTPWKQVSAAIPGWHPRNEGDPPAAASEPAPPPAAAAEPVAGEKPPWGSDDDFDPARAWKLIEDLRGDNHKIKTDRDGLRTKVQQHEEASKTEGEKLADRLKTTESDATTAKAEAARLRVALRKGLTETQAKRLVGETEEDLEKDAEELLASFKSDEGQEPRRRPQERLRPGAAPAAEPEDNDPAKLAARVSRNW